MANYNPNESSSLSQNKQILAYLEDGNTITSLEALNLFGCMRLASRISDLAQYHPIKKRWVITPSGKRVMQYYM